MCSVTACQLATMRRFPGSKSASLHVVLDRHHSVVILHAPWVGPWCETKARAEEVYCQSASTLLATYSGIQALGLCTDHQGRNTHAYQSQTCFVRGSALGGGGTVTNCSHQLSPEHPTTPLTFRFTLSLSFPPQFRQPIPTHSDCWPPFTIFASHPTLRPPIRTTLAHPHIPSEDNATASHMLITWTDTNHAPVRLPHHQPAPQPIQPRGFNPLSALFYIIYSPFADAPFLLQDACLCLLSHSQFRSRMYAHICTLFRLSPLILF